LDEVEGVRLSAEVSSDSWSPAVLSDVALRCLSFLPVISNFLFIILGVLKKRKNRHGHIENDTSNNSSIVACVFVTAVRFLPSRCLATIGFFFYRTEPLPSNDKGIFFTKPLSSNDRGDTQTHAHRQQRDLISLLYFFSLLYLF
jgi:hypothetical protein